MQLTEVRQRYLEFFKKRGHAVVPSASLVPENDPTTLFTGSGMQPLVPYLLGKNHPVGVRLVDSQKCFRAMDIEEVGDNRHTTFFEMLGNWSLGDYFKTEQLPWILTFLTDQEAGVGLDPSRLYVTAFIGDERNGIPRDNESAEIWQKLFVEKGIEAKVAEMGSEADGAERGMREGERIFLYDAKKNWWSRSGTPDKMPAGEPGGPDSEVFYDFGTPHNEKFGANCHPNCDCGRFLEIGNSVFMEYLKQPDGSFGKLPKRNVDFGGGLERITAATIGSADVFRVDALANVISEIEKLSGKMYGTVDAETRSFRVIADHLRAAVFTIADGVMPGNTERNYFVRRLLRRAVRHVDLLGMEENTLHTLVSVIVRSYGDAYPELTERERVIVQAVDEEERNFRKTLARGMKKFEEYIRFYEGSSTGESRAVIFSTEPSHYLSQSDVFSLITTYGFPKELIEEIAKEKGLKIEWKLVDELLAQHRDLSRSGAEQKFKGGLADTAEKTVRLHTAHHLLLRALQIVLGPEAHQRGSNITQERLRIDFSYGQKMTDEQKQEVERIVNEKIEEGLPVIRSEMSKDEAEKLGAEHEFGQTYPDRVSVYSVGPKGATVEDPQFDKRFSIEFCGGPHVENTSELAEGGKHFKIQKEEAVAAGVRRIRAVLE
jgi:alanyl-tRNA synthetase